MWEIFGKGTCQKCKAEDVSLIKVTGRELCPTCRKALQDFYNKREDLEWNELVDVFMSE